jgi:uncharacterized protein
MTTDRRSTAGVQNQTMAVSASLWTAAKANDVVQLARLLDEGSPIDEHDGRGYSPLMLAGYAGNLEAVDLLLGRGADPNTIDLFGNTVLMAAAYKGFVKVVLRLLAAGADPAAMNYGGLDARGFALTYGRDDVFAVLDQLAQLADGLQRAPSPVAPVQPAPPHAVAVHVAPPQHN